MSDLLPPMGAGDLVQVLTDRGHPWTRVDEVVEAVAGEHGLTDEHGQHTRDFTVSLIVEVIDRLGPVPKKAGRPLIGRPVKVWLEEDQIAELGRRTAALGISRSDLVRGYVRECLEKAAEE